MRILLDECVPRRLKKNLRSQGRLVLTVTDAGLSSYTNGQLLRRIDGQFDVFITVDKSIQFQQDLAAYDIAFVLLRSRSNDIADVEPVLTRFLTRVDELKRRALLVVE
ncbi:MAG TPA: DUF5615 family PIN-like protein [Thermoanaerobaculia bacterium]|nr:DUF5615 family PIN-like protein [Thermoanaerobaculia bacterium]